MTTYLLDTNILSDLVRHPNGKIQARIARTGQTHVCTSIIVASEMKYGLARQHSARLATQLEMILAHMDVLPLDAPADECYARLRASLEKRGTPIGANDMLIAAHALALDSVLVTDNVREFARVKSLRVENWLR